MVFNSHEFILFFLAVFTAYFLLPHGFRWMLLLGASCLFYMAFVPVYILILLGTVFVDYCAAIGIEASKNRRARKAWLILGVTSTVLILAVFKYFNFLNANVEALAQFIGWNYPVKALDILLPLGLSFHTFQSLAYVIEVYYGRQKAERHLGMYFLYVMFFPQLVAGPIERPQQLLPQLREKHAFDWDLVISGLRLMLWGFFKKIVIADRIAPAVDRVYDNPADFTGLAMITATALFNVQVFCDFSGYSDIARGAARTMGFRLMVNFDRPFHARSIGDFWRRWHISLSTWFRDYLYKPLGGSKMGPARWRLNIMMVFAVSGLWHGASWNFVIWGLMHGSFLVAEAWTQGWRDRMAVRTGFASLPRLRIAFQILVTFSLVCFSRIFFRAETFEDALYVMTHIFDVTGWTPAMSWARDNLLGLGLRFTDIAVLVASLAAMEAVHCLQYRKPPAVFVAARPVWVRWAAYQGLVVWVLWFGTYKTSEFIYFQF